MECLIHIFECFNGGKGFHVLGFIFKNTTKIAIKILRTLPSIRIFQIGIYAISMVTE